MPFEMELGFTAPYDWESISGFLAARAARGVEIVERHRYLRSFAIEGIAGHVEVSDQFAVSIHAPESVVPDVIARLRRVFDLDAEPLRIAEHLVADPVLRPLVSARPGLRVPGAWDPFELGVRAILGQQITVAAATQLAAKLIVAFGQPYPCGAGLRPASREGAGGTPAPHGGLTHLFPTAERLRDAGIASIGMPRARAASISALAAASIDDPALFSADGLARLRKIRGIGEWTAQYIAMRALRSADAFPAGDIALQRALAGGGARPTSRELEARAERWRPWRAYAALHLWRGDTR